MGTFRALALGVTLALLAPPVVVFAKAPQGQAAKPQAQADKEDLAAAVDKLAKQVFANADRNHNKVLNKSEFKVAYELLENAVNEWGQAGLIGRPQKKPAKKDKDKGQAELKKAVADVSVDKLAKSNKVSPDEFAYFVHSVVDDADQHWREYNIAMAAQRKAYADQRKAMGNNRGRYRYKRPFPL